MQPRDGTISYFWDGVSKSILDQTYFFANTMTANIVCGVDTDSIG